jgi:hypothetical protein
MGNGLFGDRPVGVVSVVEAPLSRYYAHRARVAFWAVTVAAGGLSVAVLSIRLPLIWAVPLSLFVGGLLGLLVAVLVRVWPVLRVLWWWAFEITTAGVLVAGVSWLVRATSPVWALILLAAAAGLGWAVGRVRRWVSAWGWCTVVRHRLRYCFAEFIRSQSRMHPLRLPLILLAKPTPAGMRVWVWLRPGLDLTDLEGRTPKLAVACWAGEVRVVRASARYAALIRVDVTRRDPLTDQVASPLAAHFDDTWSDAPVSPGMPPLGLDLADIPEPPEEPTNRRR